MDIVVTAFIGHGDQGANSHSNLEIKIIVALDHVADIREMSITQSRDELVKDGTSKKRTNTTTTQKNTAT